jgi:hypothetical protein
MSDPLSRAEGKVRGFEDDLAEIEPWKPLHDEAMACREIEYLLSRGVAAYRFLASVEEEWRERVLRGERAFSREDRDRFETCLRGWLVPCEKVERLVSELESRGYSVENAVEFRECHAEAKWLLARPEEVFDRPAFVAARDQAIDAHRRDDSLEWPA